MKTKQRTKRLDVAVAEDKAASKALGGGVDKRATTFSATTKDASGTGETGGVMEPTSEQLAKINEFTRSPKQASDLAVFSTWSCNDLEDRDIEKFTTDTVLDFAKLPQPFSPIGKSYMVGHDYTKLPVGRIFDASSEKKDGVTWLKNDVYIPRTDANKSLIENIDFGVNWAVSVGVMLESSECGLTFCGAQMSRYGFCYSGHDKGYFYKEDGEEDSWGYPMPVPEETAGAQKCIGLMKGAKDFYELSQVFLGAQFYAELEKSPNFSGVIKAASAKGIPVIGLSAKEAEELDPVMPHMDPRAIHAQRQFGAKVIDDAGTLEWKDDNNLVWNYSPTDSEVMCLGKQSDNSEESDDGSAAQAEPDAAALGEDDGVEGGVGGGSDEVHGASADDGQPGSAEQVGEGAGSDGSVDPDATASASEGEAVSKAAVLTALRGLKAPSVVLSAVESAQGEDLGAALSPLLATLAASQKEVESLSAKAALGTKYVDSLKSEAIDWYVRANTVEGSKGVNTDLFGKMLDQCGDSVELIEGLLNMQKGLAQAKFPAAVRRSTFPDNANEPSGAKLPELEGGSPKEDKTVSRIHG